MFPATILNTSLVLSLGTLFTEISKILTKFIFFFDADKFVLSFLLISKQQKPTLPDLKIKRVLEYFS